ncbi:MAG: UDP-N-acetylenolpyruvoylglucosamine reductase [Deltaproteobacteria bacterium]|nr:MAG: UDP-N-acetylenolpyruvoylglucosamine reductase [Deltaproteobacteria bacterium]
MKSKYPRPPLVAESVALARHTTMGVGGEARYFFVAEDVEGLRAALKWASEEGLPVITLGNGSNVIVSDEGVEGLVIILGRGFRAHFIDADGVVTAGAATMMPTLARFGVERGFGDLLFMSGIPGSIGGGVLMNAGAEGFDLSGIVEWVEYMTADGATVRLSRDEIAFSYRRSSLVGLKGAVVTHVGLKSHVAPLAVAECEERVRNYMLGRRLRQPGIGKNSGSIFKNPSSEVENSANPHKNLTAGALLDRAGMKGVTVGGAQIAVEHANWIVNLGAATGSDVRELIYLARARVLDLFGVELEREVILLPEDIS